jgi:hypothetical protein
MLSTNLFKAYCSDRMSLYHCYTKYEATDPDTVRRNFIAQATWKQQPWTEIPVRDEDLSRLWKEEGRQFAYLRDVFSKASDPLKPDDVLIYTNADIHCRADCSMQVLECLRSAGACYAFRRDFGRLEKPVESNRYASGNLYCGSDLCGFRVSWWRQHRQNMPDMILGLEAWDPCWRLLVERTNPGKTVCLRDIIAHERHNSYWERGENRMRLKGQVYCRELAARWLKGHGINPAQHGL